MVMDYLRSLYYSSMRLYRDRPDLLTPGRWHWCPPGAAALPFPHAFGSFTMDPYMFDSDPAVGEVRKKNGHVRAPENPRYLGTNYCGSIETWQTGALYSQRGTPAVDDEGVPICCHSGPPIPGGGECGGEATWVEAPVGGGDLDGAGLGSPSPVPYMSCAVCPAGTWEQWATDISGATGDFAPLNRRWIFSAPSGCTWTETVGGDIGRFFLLGGGVALADWNLTSADVAYVMSPLSCTEAMTLTFFESSTGTGTYPSSIVVYPYPPAVVDTVGGGDLDGGGVVSATVGGGDLDGAGLTEVSEVGGGDLDGAGLEVATVGGGDLDGAGLSVDDLVGGGDLDGAGLTEVSEVGGGDLDGAGLSVDDLVGGGDLDGGGIVDAGPTVLVYDQFTDSNGTPLDSHVVAPINLPGNAWDLLGSGWEIQGNAAMPVIPHGLSGFWTALLETGESDGITITCDVGDQFDYGGIMVRGVDDLNYIYVFMEGPSIKVFAYTSGIPSGINSANCGLVNGNIYQIKVVVSGSNLTITCNGVTFVATTSTHLAATKHGIAALTTLNTFDEFKITQP